MQQDTTRATIYFDKRIHKALRIKAAETNRSMSEIVSEAVREALREDEEDLAAFEQRAHEKGISYEALLKKLKADGTL
jgi:plasmid stability protein